MASASSSGRSGSSTMGSTMAERYRPPVRTRPVAVVALALAVLAACGGGGPSFPRDGRLRLNEIQVRGTHNSYHPPLPSLDVQLDDGARQLELDVNAQSSGAFAVYHTATDMLSSCL